MNIDLTCRECGSNHFTLNEAATDACPVACQDCGRQMGTLELKEQVARNVLAKSRPVPTVTLIPTLS